MNRTSFALLSAALLLAVPVSGQAQQGPAPQGGARAPTTRPPAVQPGQRLAPISLQGRYLAARVGEQDHDYDAAADQMDQALALTPLDPELIYAVFRLRMYAGRIDSAAELAPAVLATRPGDGFANLVMAIQAIKKGEYKAAEQQLTKIGTENQLGTLREYVMAWLKAGEKDFSAARALLVRLKPAAGERAEAPSLVIEGQIDEMAGDKAAAEAKYRRAMSIDRNGLRTTISVAEGLRRLGKDAEAREILRTYGTRYSDSVVMDGLMGPNAPMPKPPTPASGIAEILFDIGGILASDPRNQRTDLALIFYQLATALKPDQDFAWLMIAGLYEQFNQIPKAVAALGKIGPNSPLYWQARLRTAALDAQEDKFDQAVARLKTLVAEKPDRIDAALTLADLLRGKDRFAEAVAAYDTAISRLGTPDERHWQVYFGRGIVLERTKNWPKAEADMKKALELSPEQPYVLNYLGYSWIDRGENLERGREMVERAVRLRPNDGHIVDSLGWAHFKLGNLADAVRYMERAVELKAMDPVINDHLGDVYWAVGRYSEARFQWERALLRAEEADLIAQIREKLGRSIPRDVAGAGRRP